MTRATQWTGTPSRTDADEDRALLERIAHGDRIAMQKFYFAFHRRLSRFLLRTVRRPEQAEEIINDTMFVVWRQASQFRGESRVSTWVMGIAYRLALRHLRTEHRLRPPALVDQGDTSERETAHDAGAGQREQRQWIERGLASLSPPQRLAVELAYFMGYSCDEIASITDTPVNTVKTRLFHAREQLRTLLSNLSGNPVEDTDPQRKPA